MNHIPKFLVYKKRNPMSSKHRPKGPKLERSLAMRILDYELPSPSSSTSPSVRTRSLDLVPPRSFRIQGIDGEFELICQTLGLSGPEDFGIPVADWEARKARSISDLLRRPRVQEEAECEGNDCVLQLSDKFKDSIRVNDEVISEFIRTRDDNTNPDVIVEPTYHCGTWGRSEGVEQDLRAAPPSILPQITDNTSSTCISGDDNDGANMDRYAIVGSVDYCNTRGGILDRPRVMSAPPSISPQIVDNTSSIWDNSSDGHNGGVNVDKYAIVGSIEYSSSRGGINGVRPALLTPPPSISLPIIDNTGSTWDIIKSFAPDSDIAPSSARGLSSYFDDEEDREIWNRGNTVLLSQSYSFTTTSNDDDSSSTTTEPMSNISPNGRFRRTITYWEKGELLGRGSFGSVYEGIADGGYFIAVKEVSLLDQGEMGRQSIYQLEQEIALLSQFEHENIVQYYGTDKDEAHLYIFLELVTKGSLLSLYQKYRLRDSQAFSYTRQILHGLKYLHERNVVHRDIKCANILVGADGSVKLADFGLAKATKLNDVRSCKGTAFWMAPEVVRGRNQGYGLPADIWSLGCTVLEMLTQQIPYSPLECMQALFRIGRGEPPPIPDSISSDARDFISRCLKVDPNDRPTAIQLLDHPFVERPLSTSSGSSSPYHFIGRG